MRQTLQSTVAMVLLATGLAGADPVKTEHKVIATDDAESILALVDFGLGTISLHAAPRGSLLDATLTYDRDYVDVYVDYRRRQHRGILELATDFDHVRINRKIKNVWDVGLTGDVPMALDIDIGAAEADLDLTGLSVTRLELDVGAADCEVWWDESNESTLVEFAIDCGASSLRMVGLGYANFEYLDFEGGLGRFELDFTGDWKRSAEADIQIGLGKMEIVVPRDIGVRLETEASFGSVDVDRWFVRIADDVYESKNFDDAEIKLHLEVQLGMGSLEVRSTDRDTR